MYCVEPAAKKLRVNGFVPDSETYTESQNVHNIALTEDEISNELSVEKEKSPILENKERSFRKCLNSGSFSVLKRLSKFPRTILGDNVIESKFFSSASSSDISANSPINSDTSKHNVTIEEFPDKRSMNPFKLTTSDTLNNALEIDTQCSEILDSQLDNSQKENSPFNSPMKCRKSPILEPSPKNRNPFKVKADSQSTNYPSSQDSVIDNTYPMETLVTPVDSQVSFGDSPPKPLSSLQSVLKLNSNENRNSFKKSTCKVSGLKRTASLPSNQPTLLSKFGFQKKPVLKK